MGGNNVVQQAAGVVDTNDQWFQDEMFSTDCRAQPELVRTLVDNGADTVKWFQDLGIKYAPISGCPAPADLPWHHGASGPRLSGRFRH